MGERSKQLFRYLFWGVLTTAVSWISYALFEIVCHPLFPDAAVAVANLLSWLAAVIFAFFANKYRVFQSTDRQATTILLEMGKFFASRLATGVLEICAVPLLVAAGLNQTIVGVEGMLAKVTVSVVVVLLNYVFGKWFVFRK